MLGIDYSTFIMDYLTDFKEEGFDSQKLYRLPTRAEKRMNNKPFTRDIVISDIGYYPKPHGHLVDRTKGSSAHILIFCVKGRGWATFGGKRREIGAQDALWIPAGEPHTYGSHNSDPWEIYWVHAYGSSVEALIQWTPLTSDRPLTHFSNSLALQRQFNALLQRLESGYTDHTLLEISRFFVSLTSLLHVDAGLAQETSQREKIERVMDTMRETLAAPWTLLEYAGHGGFSTTQFSLLFKRHYGTSPMAYLMELRMQRAREMLDSTSLSVKEIAAKIGYEDPLYFSRIFKKTSGTSPSSYRAAIS